MFVAPVQKIQLNTTTKQLHSAVTYGRRFFAVKSSIYGFHNYDPTAAKIFKFPHSGFPEKLNGEMKIIPLNKEWDKPTSLLVESVIPKGDFLESDTHYFCGGLPALMQAARKIEEIAQISSGERVIYVNDGKIPKTLQSGHQAHVHPSEWSSDDCSTINLIKTMLRGMGILFTQNPTNLSNYSYLHFPFSYSDFAKDPLGNTRLYLNFFGERIRQNLKQVNGVSDDDHRLCRLVTESLEYHKELSKKIEKQQGNPSFLECGRAYWSPDVKAMKKKQATWKELGIDCEFMTESEIMQETLLKKNSGLHVLRIVKDGKFFPETPQRIVKYLEDNYPNFTHYIASTEKLCLNKQNGSPVSINERLTDGRTQEISIKTFFGSLGHNQVFRDHSSDKALKPVWPEVPVTGNSTVWRCSIDVKEFEQRFGIIPLTKEDLAKCVNQLLPLANLSNLHVTLWDGEIIYDKVVFNLRASQGANFNSLVADKDDLRNMWENLDRYFIGDLEIVSAASCSKKTYISNVPEHVELSSNPQRPTTFLHGLSGIGYSVSAASLPTIKERAPKG